MTPTLLLTETSTATGTPTIQPTQTATATIPGDLNLDGKVDVLDTQLCVNVFLGSETDPVVVSKADVNSDGAVDVLDVQLVVNAYLGN